MIAACSSCSEMRFGEAQKVNEVAVFENGFGIQVQLCHRW
jgi:hypothetical protein